MPWIDHTDFTSFENAVRDVRAYFERHRDPGPLRALFIDDDVHSGLLEANITLSSDEYLRLDRLGDGLTLVKSPKGTGKTECLRSLLADEESVLLIGHRKSLIHQSCARLGLECYLDLADGHLAARRLGVCLDSLQRLQGWAGLSTFGTVVIDESEQVLAHFLSDTMSSEGRSPVAVFTIFKSLLRRARRVVALDADLGWVTFETLIRLMNERARHGRTHIVINDRPARGIVEVFRFDRQLQADLKHTLAEGKRVFVASNGKGFLDRLDAAIAEEFDGSIRSIKVTSDTVATPQVRAFIADPAARALDYDLIMASPSMGTGVDITFPGRASEIDVVYGFFDAEITTHFEMDQQLARVRHPSAVKIWVTPRWFTHDTAYDAVRGDLLRSHVFGHLLVDFDEDGQPVFDERDSFLNMAALIVSSANASKNALRRRLLRHKEHQGHAVVWAGEDDVLHLEGLNLSRAGKRLSAARRVEAVLGAEALRRDAFDDVIERLEGGGEVTEAEMWSLVRTAIELFYREPISASLIALDNDGRYRRAVGRLESCGLTSDEDCVREHLARVGDEPLDRRARFVRSPRDVATAIVHLLHRTPLMSAGVLRPGVTAMTKDDLEDFATALLANRSVIENVLGIDVRADVREKPVTSLNAILRMIGLRVRNTKRRRMNGRIVREYAFDRAAYDRILKIVETRRTKAGWRTLYEMHGWDTEKLDEKPDEWDEDEPAREHRSTSRRREKMRRWTDHPPTLSSGATAGASWIGSMATAPPRRLHQHQAVP